jgi:Helix-turn-helix domain
MSEPVKNAFDLLLDQIRVVVAEEIAKALSTNGRPPEQRGDYLTPEQAAKIMGVDVNWLYRHRRQLPFAHGVSKRLLRFDEAGLRRWMQARK